jgi:hypothetical protein
LFHGFRLHSGQLRGMLAVSLFDIAELRNCHATP